MKYCRAQRLNKYNISKSVEYPNFIRIKMYAELIRNYKIYRIKSLQDNRLDYDGDQITAKIIWSQEANEECERVMHSKSFLLNSNGSNMRIADLESIQTMYVLTKNP